MNNEIRKRITTSTDPNDILLTTVLDRQLTCQGWVSRYNTITKPVRGSMRRGRVRRNAGG